MSERLNLGATSGRSLAVKCAYSVALLFVGAYAGAELVLWSRRREYQNIKANWGPKWIPATKVRSGLCRFGSSEPEHVWRFADGKTRVVEQPVTERSRKAANAAARPTTTDSDAQASPQEVQS